MPVYEYIDKWSGEKVELIRPVERRDDVPGHLRRITVPSRVLVCPMGEPTQVQEVMNGLKECEQKNGTGDLMRKMGGDFTPQQIKNIWAQPDTED